MTSPDWRSSDRALSARLSVLERRSETAAIRALTRMLLEATGLEMPCNVCKRIGPGTDCCAPCEAWQALGHAGPWPGATRAARRMGR